MFLALSGQFGGHIERKCVCMSLAPEHPHALALPLIYSRPVSWPHIPGKYPC